ncbi:MAG: DEAD/DEAH box helicase [Candidatus Auribacterota bacterium]|jgi:replicative superfamily II helicase|nr:DEAD/DEAH box helicase [Candidatus Auribacterota bacterium]
MTDTTFQEYLNELPSILEETGVSSVIPQAHTQYIEYSLKSSEIKSVFSISSNLDLLSRSLDSLAVEVYLKTGHKNAIAYFNNAFICRRNNINKTKGNVDIEELFHLAICALGCERVSELRLTLQEHKILVDNNFLDWSNSVKTKTTEAFLLLCRKKNGWKDVNNSVKIINELKDLQNKFEKQYLAGVKDEDFFVQRTVLGDLIALYNLAKIIEVTGEYLFNGIPASPNLKIKKHYDNASDAVTDSDLELFVDKVFIGCEILLKNSIWSNTRTLGQKVREFVQELAAESREQPFIELWPSQQEAMRSSLFDPAKKSIILQMPTSAGKTLMAEFSIVQSHALNPDSTIVYVVPTRALVNQVTLQLRKNLLPIGINTESAVPVFELDPTEDELLKKDCDVLVSTPEKLELLIRAQHQVVKEISLVVVDEVHNIADLNRGSTLELFLGTVSREKPNARFLLMSPFIPNADEVGKWLADDLTAKIEVKWKPSERITAASTYIGKGQNKKIKLSLLPSAHNSDVKEEIDFVIDSRIIDGDKSKTNIAISTSLSLMNKGAVLLLCNGRDAAVKRAKRIMNYLDDVKLNEEMQAVIKYIEDELGESHILPKMIRKGVVFHHAGLSIEARFLIERLVETGDIKIICATTTLAQGVNFPIKSVIVENTKRSKQYEGWQDIPFNEFWNIAGRAGRALRDHMGLVIFVSRNNNDLEQYKTYLQSDATNVLSSILNDLNNLFDLDKNFDLKFVTDYPALTRFFQYLLHAISVSGFENISSDMEDVLRSSLVYHQANILNPVNAKKLIQVARNYLSKIYGKSQNAGLLKLIDGTGFSSMSVDLLFAMRDDFSDVRLWDNEYLFSQNNTTLTNMIKTLAYIPELDLTRLRRGGPLDIEAIANIIKEWVNGQTIEIIADKYFSSEYSDRDEKILATSRYLHNVLVSQLAWGMSALLKISLFGKEDVDWEKIGHIPAQMYYGVSSRESVILRMIGVPRNCVEKLSKEYKHVFKGKSPAYKEIREWLSTVNSNKWQPQKKSHMSGEESKKIWEMLSGVF